MQADSPPPRACGVWGHGHQWKPRPLVDATVTKCHSHVRIDAIPFPGTLPPSPSPPPRQPVPVCFQVDSVWISWDGTAWQPSAAFRFTPREDEHDGYSDDEADEILDGQDGGEAAGGEAAAERADAAEVAAAAGQGVAAAEQAGVGGVAAAGEEMVAGEAGVGRRAVGGGAAPAGGSAADHELWWEDSAPGGTGAPQADGVTPELAGSGQAAAGESANGASAPPAASGAAGLTPPSVPHLKLGRSAGGGRTKPPVNVVRMSMAEYENRNTRGTEPPAGGEPARAAAAPRPRSVFSLFGRKKK